VRVGLSSYTYTWAIGVPGRLPKEPLTLLELVERAGSLGVDALQIADNLPLHDVSGPDLAAFEARARELQVMVEVGTRGIDAAHLQHYLALAQRLGSPVLRVVIAGTTHDLTPDEAITILRPQRRAFERAGVMLAIENHDKFSTDELLYMLEALGTGWVGICLDTVNSFGALEGPEVVVEKLKPFTVNLHCKDFVIRRAEHMMGFTIEGRPVGQGQLNVPWLIDQLGGPEKDMSAIIELWTPPSATLESTVATERQWAEMSVEYLQKLLAA
jgi:3-oxoisoapionate decarboxylase